MIIALDGPAGAGKSSVAKAVAERLGIQYIDTGALYRAAAWAAIEANISLEEGSQVAEVLRGMGLRFEMHDGSNLLKIRRSGHQEEDITDKIRTPTISQGASRVGTHPGVREALLGLQRKLGNQRSSILEGRDIGTVIFPNAQLKLFLTASVEERGRRRQGQMIANGVKDLPSLEKIEWEIRQRDARDAGREIAPLLKAEDAIELDTTVMAYESVIDEIVLLAVGRGFIEV